MHATSNHHLPWARPRLTRLGPHRRRIVGDLDAFTAQAIEPAIRRLIEMRRVVVLDLSGVRVLTAGGLAMLERVQAHASSLGRRLMFLAPRDGLVHQVLDFGRLPPATILSEPGTEDERSPGRGQADRSGPARRTGRRSCG